MKYSQSQMLLPLLNALSEGGGRLKTGDLCDAVAECLNVPSEVRSRKVWVGGSNGGEVNLFERRVRWAQQTAKLKGLVEPDVRPYWRLRGKGERALKEALPGVVMTVFVTDKGVALYGSCEDAVALIEDKSVQLLFTSPPYPLSHRSQKPYGNVAATEYCDWLLRLVEKWPRKLTPDGSLVINLGDLWEAGMPNVSLYQERLLIRLHDQLGLKLCQRFYWQSPTRLPLPKTWVAVQRIRVKNSVEQLWWLSQSGRPYASNREVLTPYSAKMKRTIAKGGEQRQEIHPSGHDIRKGAFAKDNGGAIPGNILVFPNAETNTGYVRGCKAEGLPIHPARFPAMIPNFFIRFLTRPDDLVYDPFGGSGVTAQEAEKLGRRWMTSEIMKEYVEGSRFRFPETVGTAA